MLLLLISAPFSPVAGHGRLLDPPGRSTMWRFGFNSEHNYNDNQLFCGGFTVQWNQNNGSCGICGDNIKDNPRENEAPDGKYAKGIIVKEYDVGQTIEVKIHITANHKGWVEYRLCQNDDPKARLTQQCFDQHVLADAATGETRFTITSTMFQVAHTLKLPDGVRCRDCVLQWKYNTGNSWGTDFVTGEGCIGCGAQEQFYACADVAIGHDDVEVGSQDETVQTPAGDVDETKWVEEAQTYTPGGECNCPCAKNSAAHRGTAGLFGVLTLMLINILK